MNPLLIPFIGKAIDFVGQQAKSKTVVANVTLGSALPLALSYLEPVLTKKEFGITAAIMVIGLALLNFLLRQKTNMSVSEKTRLSE